MLGPRIPFPFAWEETGALSRVYDTLGAISSLYHFYWDWSYSAKQALPASRFIVWTFFNTVQDFDIGSTVGPRIIFDYKKRDFNLLKPAWIWMTSITRKIKM